METIKSYTDLEQSKILKDILPIESAIMSYLSKDGRGIEFFEEPVVIDGTLENDDIPCWSLAALRACLPSGINIDGTLYVFESHNTFDNEWVYGYKYEDNMAIYIKSKNDIDACVEMIIKLYEQNLLKN